MTNTEPNLLALLERLGTEEVPPLDPILARAQQVRVVRALQQHTVGLPARTLPHEKHFDDRRSPPFDRARPSLWSRGRPLLWGASIAAGVALAGFGWMATGPSRESVVAVNSPDGVIQVENGSALVVRAGNYETRVLGRYGLVAGDLVRTPTGSRAQVTLRSEIVAELDANSQVRLGDITTMAHSDVWLDQGKAQFRVAKRPANGRFSVHAPDAIVTVHGTTFTVDVRPLATGVQTSVTVSEGQVSVSGYGQTRWLGSGDSWQSPEPPVASTSPDLPAPPATLPPNTAKAAKKPGYEAAVVQSTLAEERTQFAAAMTTKRRGEHEKALMQLNQFLTRYPNSPLMPNARVERFRLLERLGRRGEAAVAAREYMVYDPDGFAQDEARTLALPSTPATKP